MSVLIVSVLVFMVSIPVSLVMMHYLLPWVKRNDVMAIPSSRSSHTSATPVGGGWVLFGCAIIVWIGLLPYTGLSGLVVLVGVVALAIISWIDDRRTVPSLVRIVVQGVVVMAAMFSLEDTALVFGGYLPFWLDRIVTAFLWLWFINLYNFMDGIDGLAGTETLFIAMGIACIGVITGLPSPSVLTSAAIAGSSIGFLWWNWHPARIFMGDIGSISMGYLLGWFLIVLASSGYLMAALILPLYFIVDASLTLLLRVARGEKFWKPHKTHFYQKAAGIQKNHAFVVKRVIIANLYLLAAAIQSVFHVWVGGLLAVVTVTTLMVYFYSIYNYEHSR